MHQTFFRLNVMLSFVFLVSVARGQDSKTITSPFRLESTDGLELVKAKAEPVTYRGEPLMLDRRAVTHRENLADLICFGRLFIANPDLAWLADPA